VRTYISEPDRGRRNWEGLKARDAVCRNRSIRGPRGNRLLRHRGKRLARAFAHFYRTGRMRRVHLRGRDNILKRTLLHAGALNLGLLMRQPVGIGTRRSLQGRVASLLVWLWSLVRSPGHLWNAIGSLWHPLAAFGPAYATTIDESHIGM
jgi:transposase